ncbi:hypothetical protein ABZY09_49205, partial [Streptomyces sp. NPDC002928]
AELKEFAGFHSDPSTVLALRERTQQTDILNKQARVIAALAGPRPSQAARIRARSAFAVASDATAGAVALSDSGLTKSERDELLAAALRALQPG